MANTSELLAAVPFFALLDSEERAALAQKVELRQVRGGQTIFAMGDPGDALYVVSSGEVEIFVKNHQGERITLEVAGAGHVFGELSLLDGGPRTATAIARTDAELLSVNRQALDEFLRLSPAAAMDMLEATGKRLRETSKLLRASSIRNVNAEAADKRSRVERTVDWVADFSGSLEFLFIHVAFFAGWILLNAGPVARTRIGGFDPFPFGLLTMCVSLEAIMLSVMVLLSQNRSAAREKIRNDVEYETNVRAELEIAALHEKVDDLRADLLARLAALDRRT